MKSYLNILIFLLLVVISFSWMITVDNHGEIVDYNKNFYITDSDVEVKLFVLKNNVYVEQSQAEEAPLIELAIMEPGVSQKYRFDITNNNDIQASVKIAFAELEGDVEILKPFIYVSATNPIVWRVKMDDALEFDVNSNVYSFTFLNRFNIPANSTQSLYFNILLDSYADNTAQGKTLTINKIMFIKP
ncbi:MAG: hypothetical protein PHO63_02955 [Bacilli bacterium]|nr:hypothetical protein [Bacilli bacterium]MDD4808905.1 hypothetical protein [Bacilli bacterium]